MLVSDIERALEAPPYSFDIATVRQQGATYTAIATNANDQVAVDAALPGVITALQNAANADTTTLSDLRADVQNILTRLQNGISAVATDKTALTAAASLAAAKPIIDNILTRENALYTDLRKVVKWIEKQSRNS